MPFMRAGAAVVEKGAMSELEARMVKNWRTYAMRIWLTNSIRTRQELEENANQIQQTTAPSAATPNGRGNRHRRIARTDMLLLAP